MSKKRCCGNAAIVAPIASPCGNICSNPICALVILIILQKTCLLENNNSFLLILLFIGYCCCRRPVVAGAGCGGY